MVRERCHWPDRRLGETLDSRVRYGYDAKNSKRQLKMMLHLGKGDQSRLLGPNIHWHATEEGELSFLAIDDHKQEIVSVSGRNMDGEMMVYDLYEDDKRKYSDAKLEQFPSFDMQCLDCHNRPAHQFLTPDEAVDRAFEELKLEQSVPFIKKISIKLLATEYATSEEAHEAIRDGIMEFYTDNFEGSVLDREEDLENSIEQIQAIFDRNVFPEMNVNWTTYPNNIGHRTSPGCFRCHSGDLKASDGTVLSHECDLCHVFFEKDRLSESLLETPADASFVHPFAHEKHYTEIKCWDCHAGASSPYSKCDTCHAKTINPEKMTFSCSACHKPGNPIVEVSSCKPCHPTIDSKLHAQKDHDQCLSCHDAHTWKMADHSSCESCHKPRELRRWGKHLPDGKCKACEDFKGVRSTMRGLGMSEHEEFGTN